MGTDAVLALVVIKLHLAGLMCLHGHQLVICRLRTDPRCWDVKVGHLSIDIGSMAEVLSRCSLIEAGTIDMTAVRSAWLSVVEGRGGGSGLTLHKGDSRSNLLLVHHLFFFN